MMSVKTIASLSIMGLLISNAWGWGNKNPSQVFGKSEQEAEMIHGMGCLCLGCQEVRNMEEQKRQQRQLEEADYRRWLKENDEQDRLQGEKNEEMIRAEWDRELRAMGVVRWSYSAVTKFKSPRVKATIVFANGRVINFNQKIKHTLPVPTPVDIARSAQCQ